MIDEFDWDIFFTSGVSRALCLWKEQFLSIMSECIPRTLTSKWVHLLWLSAAIRKDISKRNRLFRLARNTGDMELLCKYKMFRKKVLQSLRTLKWDYSLTLKPNTKTFGKL